jgi:hypothetical protein
LISAEKTEKMNNTNNNHKKKNTNSRGDGSNSNSSRAELKLKPKDFNMSNSKCMRVFPQTWKILQSNCPKGLRYCDYLHSIIVKTLGTKMKTPESVLKTQLS